MPNVKPGRSSSASSAPSASTTTTSSEVASIDTGEFVPSSEQLALLRERLDLVRQLPERPRRFLLRLMVGYSYNDIAAAEDVSYRIVNRQVARAKRLLRQLDEDYRS